MADFVYYSLLITFAAASIWLSIIDFKEKRLPNRIVWPLNFCSATMLGIHSVITGNYDSFIRAALAGATCFAFYFTLRFISPSAIGFGDVKLSIAIGLITGFSSWQTVISAVFFAFIGAAIFALIGLIARKLNLKGSLAFGPFMLLGAWLALFS